MGSIPVLTSVSDPRNLLTLGAFIAALLLLYRGIMDFEVILILYDKPQWDDSYTVT